MTTAPLKPERFETVVDLYVAHRLTYPEDLLARLAAETGLGPTSRLLDLGCGPGFIANAMAPHAGEVIGVDPSTAMIAAARARAPANVTYLEGSSFDLSAVPTPLDLVTMGRSFHWMDRDATLASLDPMLNPSGAVALLGDHVVKGTSNAWWHAANKIGKDYAVLDECNRARMSEAWESSEDVLARSAFSDMVQIGVVRRHWWTLDTLVGQITSRSATTPELLGERVEEMRRDIAAALEPFGPGPWTTLNMHWALIARRP